MSTLFPDSWMVEKENPEREKQKNKKNKQTKQKKSNLKNLKFKLISKEEGNEGSSFCPFLCYEGKTLANSYVRCGDCGVTILIKAHLSWNQF